MMVADGAAAKITLPSVRKAEIRRPTGLSLVAEVCQHFYFLTQFSGFDVPVSEHQSVRILDN